MKLAKVINIIKSKQNEEYINKKIEKLFIKNIDIILIINYTVKIIEKNRLKKDEMDNSIMNRAYFWFYSREKKEMDNLYELFKKMKNLDKMVYVETYERPKKYYIFGKFTKTSKIDKNC